MLAIFCLRLAAGMLAAYCCSRRDRSIRAFFRTHFLTALALTALAAVFLRDIAGLWLWLTLASLGLLTVLGSMVWMLENAPGGQRLVILTPFVAILALLQAGYWVREEGEPGGSSPTI